MRKYPTKKQSLSDDEKLRVNSNDSDTRRPLPETCNSFKPRRDNAQKHGSEDGGGCFDAGLCLFVICLLLLLFWGQSFATLCTSIWFCLIPRRARYYVSAGDGLDFEEYKKKLIMQGRLERNHARRVNPFQKQ